MTAKKFQIPKKGSTIFFCENCDYTSSRESQYNRHLLTSKHEKIMKYCQILPKSSDTEDNVFICICGKEYSHRQSLANHKKKCSFEHNTFIKNTECSNNEIMIQILNENKEFKNLIIEQSDKLLIQNEKIIELASKPSQTTINNYGNTNNNSNNNNKQQFNLNFFLNETCKDAMNIDEFINTLVITDAELEDFGKLGYVQGISNILIRGLKELGEHHRPIHNTDKKRNVLYMKYKEGWEKEVDEPLVFKNYLPTEIPKMTVRRMIYRISKKGFFGMNTWKQNNPTHSDITTKKHEEYMVLLHQLMCGHEPPDSDISKIVKVVSEKTLFITKR